MHIIVVAGRDTHGKIICHHARERDIEQRNGAAAAAAAVLGEKSDFSRVMNAYFAPRSRTLHQERESESVIHAHIHKYSV